MPVPLLTPGATITDLRPATWDAEARRRAFWRTSDALRDGDGKPYAFAADAEGAAVIPKHPREDDTRWTLRRQLCKPVSQVRQIADHYLSHVCAREVQRVGVEPPPLALMVADADGVGTPLDRLWRQAGRLAFVEQTAYALVDYQGPAAPQSAADQTAARQVLRIVPADDVLCVERTTGNRIRSAIVRLPATDSPCGWILWRIDGATGQRAVPDADGETVQSADAPAGHLYGRCPLLQIGPMPAIIPAVAEGQRAIAQADSLLRYRIHEDAMPWIVVTGAQNSAAFTAEFAKNPAFTAFEDQNVKADRIGSDVAVATSLRETLAADEERLFQAAKVRPVQAATAQSAESGVAQAFRFVDADVELAEVSLCLEQAENAVWVMLAKAAGIAAVPVATRPRSFVPFDRGAALDRLMLVAASTLPEPLKAREYQLAAAQMYPGDPGLAEELKQWVSTADARTPGEVAS